MALWIGYSHDGRDGFGRLDGDRIAVFTGDLFAEPTATGQILALDAVTIALPCRPSKLIALWNNFFAMAEKNALAQPEAPLFLVKAANTYRPSGATIAVPEAAGRAVYEGELGIVIGRAARDVDEDAAASCIFGYTCINDVTAPSILRADPSFPQWCRAKGLDGFGPFGPVGLLYTAKGTAALLVPAANYLQQATGNWDGVFLVAAGANLLVSLLAIAVGDVIACGTSNGVGPIPKGATVEVVIDGIGTLSNRFE